MITRQLLVGTALAAMLATGALAQSSSSAMDSSMASSSTASDMSSSAMDQSSSTPADQSSATSSSMMDSSAMSSQMSTASSQDSSMMSSAATDTTATTTTGARQPVQILSGYTTVDSDRLASKIIGQPVYDGKAKDSNNLGDIKDLVLDENGQVAAVVVGVGGFLGIGEKQVAVDFAALQFVIADDNTERYVLQTTKDELTNAPDFKTVDDNPASSVPANGTSSAAPDATASSAAPDATASSATPDATASSSSAAM
jgi:sporulation protein YlmC with PRC-barrel domain